jgi:hypothetical protein
MLSRCASSKPFPQDSAGLFFHTAKWRSIRFYALDHSLLQFQHPAERKATWIMDADSMAEV